MYSRNKPNDLQKNTLLQKRNFLNLYKNLKRNRSMELPLEEIVSKLELRLCLRVKANAVAEEL